MIDVDISNIWGEISLPDLLAVEAEISVAHQTLMEGTGADGGMRGWLNLPMEEPSAEICRLLNVAARIQENSDVLVVLGSCSACLGARGAVELLRDVTRNADSEADGIEIFFGGDSFSTHRWNALMKLLDGKNFSVCVIAVSAFPLETSVWFRNLRWILERRYGTEEARKRVYTVTGTQEGVLRAMSGEEGWESFCLPENLDDRFSLLSPAGLLPMAAAGIDITEILQGAWDAKREYDLRSFENPVWLYAAVRGLMQRSGKNVELLESYEPNFRGIADWWRQLFGFLSMNGCKGPFPVWTELPAQQVAPKRAAGDGHICFETLLRMDLPGDTMVIGEDVKNMDELNYLAGKKLDQLSAAACQITAECHADAGIPVISVDCGEMDAHRLGALIWFFQLSYGICAYMMGCSPYERLDPERENLAVFLGKVPRESEYMQSDDE